MLLHSDSTSLWLTQRTRPPCESPRRPHCLATVCDLVTHAGPLPSSQSNVIKSWIQMWILTRPVAWGWLGIWAWRLHMSHIPQGQQGLQGHGHLVCTYIVCTITSAPHRHPTGDGGRIWGARQVPIQLKLCMDRHVPVLVCLDRL